MVAVPLPERRRVSGSRRSQVAQRKVQRQKRSLELLQGALSTHRMARQAPWLANLHRVTDGALLATGVAALAMAGLTLHWQGRWGGDFRQLQRAQALEHRLMESQSALEQHYLRQAKRPGALVPTPLDVWLGAGSAAQGPIGSPLTGVQGLVPVAAGGNRRPNGLASAG